jgi:hypothetical protein
MSQHADALRLLRLDEPLFEHRDQIVAAAGLHLVLAQFDDRARVLG